jgi:hypothetical protein
MPKSANQITFDLKPLKVGEGWYIVVTYPGGMQEHIPGFHSQAEAEQWLSGSHNGYFQDSRYVYFHDNPHPTTPPPLVLTPRASVPAERLGGDHKPKSMVQICPRQYPQCNNSVSEFV